MTAAEVDWEHPYRLPDDQRVQSGYRAGCALGTRPAVRQRSRVRTLTRRSWPGSANC